MFRLRTGYLIGGIVTGCIIFFSFLWTIPDGKLHIVFCNVGQGDSAYIRFPDGRDMVVDGGPDDTVLQCLGKHMPFWDRHINLIAMTHPQKDHMQGLISVLDRFAVDYFVRSDIDNSTEGYSKLIDVIRRKNISVKFMTAGDHIAVGSVSMSFLWPSVDVHSKELNDHSIVFLLRYKSFDAVFTGDADSRVEPQYTGDPLPDDTVELLKVPHHGSKTGMTQAFIDWLHPKLAVISVGKNNYGHPSHEAIGLLQSVGAKIFRTDQDGDIEIVTDGREWLFNTQKKGVH